jgi:hypothetical protein
VTGVWQCVKFSCLTAGNQTLLIHSDHPSAVSDVILEKISVTKNFLGMFGSSTFGWLDVTK